MLGTLRGKVVPLRSERARSERAEDLFHICRLTTSQAIQRGLMRERLHFGRWSLASNATCTALTSSADHAELERRSLERWPKLGIRPFMVVVYDATDEAGRARVRCGYDASGTRLVAASASTAASCCRAGRQRWRTGPSWFYR